MNHEVPGSNPAGDGTDDCRALHCTEPFIDMTYIVKHQVIIIIVFSIPGTTREAESLFLYHNGQSFKDFVTDNAAFVPKFLDEANQTLVAEAGVECGGLDKQECVFDYVFTLNADVARDTQGTQDQSAANDLEISKPFSILDQITPPRQFVKIDFFSKILTLFLLNPDMTCF